MKKLGRNILWMATAGVLALGMVACGGKSTTGSSSGSKEEGSTQAGSEQAGTEKAGERQKPRWREATEASLWALTRNSLPWAL